MSTAPTKTGEGEIPIPAKTPPKSTGTSADGTKYTIFTDTKKSEGCDWKGGLKWTGIALLIVGLLGALVGALVYSGVMGITLTGLGAMASATSLYVLLAGVGLAFIMGVLLITAKCLSAAKEAEAGKKPWTCCAKPETTVKTKTKKESEGI